MSPPRADAIVVLGCRFLPAGRPSPTVARRIERAARAHGEGVAPLVVVTGGRRWSGIAEATAMRWALRSRGVPEAAIVGEYCALSTAENAAYAARLLRARRLGRAAVVTCAWHVPRALRRFRAEGVDAFGLPALDPGAPAVVRLWRAARERVSEWWDGRGRR